MVHIFGNTVFRMDAVRDDYPPPSTSKRRIQLSAIVSARTAPESFASR